MAVGGTVPHILPTQTFRQVGKLSNTFLLSNEDSALRDASPMSHPPLHSCEVGRIDMWSFPKWTEKVMPFTVQKAPLQLKEKHRVPSERVDSWHPPFGLNVWFLYPSSVQ